MLNPALHNTLILIARIFFSAIFISSAIGKIMGFTGTLAYIEAAGLAWHPLALEVVAIAFELIGGLLVLLGWHTRFGAALLVIFTLTTTFLIHHFWSYPPEAAQMQMIQFMKNIAITGGALYIFCFGAGRYSIDGRSK